MKSALWVFLKTNEGKRPCVFIDTVITMSTAI